MHCKVHDKKEWYAAEKYLEESHLLLQHTPIWSNQFFVPGLADASFKFWASPGITNIKDLYLTDSDTVMSFEELRSNFNLGKKHFFKYLQVRKFVKVNQNNVLTRLEHPTFKKCGKGQFDKRYHIRVL